MTSSLLLLLPPSETKRDGGNAALRRDSDETSVLTTPPDAGLAWPELEAVRSVVADALVRVSRDEPAGMAALKLSAKQAAVELDRNRSLATAARMPAIDRYTGVLYDALDSSSLDERERSWLAHHAAVHSALYGLVGAEEAIAAYRLSSTSRLPGLALKRHWAEAVSSALGAHTGFVVDLRSKGYIALGPIPEGVAGAFVEVVSRGPDGELRALNHFNKKGKGLFVRALAQYCAAAEPGALPRVESAGDLCELAERTGFRMTVVDERTVQLEVDEV